MRALILAAGRGSRMGAATNDRPKGMLPLAGRPLIAWQIEALRGAGAEEVAIVTGYRGDAVDVPAERFENPRWAETSMVGSLACAEEWLSADTCLVSYADVVYPAAAARLLHDAPGDVALVYDARWLALWRRRFADPLSDAETFRVDGAGFLAEIGGKPASVAEVRGQYMGLFKLTPRGAARLLARFRALDARAQDRTDVTALLGLCVAAGERIAAVPFEGWWCEIDGPADLALAREIVAEAAR